MPPSPTYPTASSDNDNDPNCIPKRYSPCPQQIIDMKVGAGRPGLSPSSVVVLVFLMTVVVWTACFFAFRWWLGMDAEAMIKELEEEEEEEARNKNGGRGSGSGGNGGEGNNGRKK
jgi:hypothetical protein